MKAGGSRLSRLRRDHPQQLAHHHAGRQAVFKAAVSNMADVSVEMMERYNLTSDDIRYLVPHQATCSIIDATANAWG